MRPMPLQILMVMMFASLPLAAQPATRGEVSALARGDAALVAGDLEKASAAYEDAARVSADAPRAWLGKARVEAKRGNTARVLDALDAIASPAPPLAKSIATDAAFDDVRSSPRYLAALERLDPCGSPAARQFDFWLGEWSVTGVNGEPLGRSRIERVLDGCAIAEFWNGASGVIGQSINFYDAKTRQWNQFWVDTSGDAWFSRDAEGNPATARGGIRDGKMILESDAATSPRVRGVWSVLADGRVRQTFEQSEDKGKSWTKVFDGFYRRTEPVAVANITVTEQK